ncbi:MAG: sensor histidine kinase, partial [Phycisphaerae bacterium]
MHIALRQRFLLGFELAVVGAAVVAWRLWPQSLWAVVLVGSVAMLAGWAVAAVSNRRLHRSISRVRRAAEAIGRGELSRRVELQPGDEIEKLVRSFNQMADRLEQTAREERELQQQLTRSEKLAVVGELAATVAHEVNNPLDGLQNCSRIIRRSADQPQQVRRMLDLMDGGLYRIEMIVRQLLSLARDEVTHLEPTRLDEVVGEAALFLEPKIAKRQIRLVQDLPEQPLWVNCDRQQMVQVVINLMLNAVDSMPEGGCLTVQVAAGKGEKTASLTVRDNGRGISPDHLPR